MRLSSFGNADGMMIAYLSQRLSGMTGFMNELSYCPVLSKKSP